MKKPKPPARVSSFHIATRVQCKVCGHIWLVMAGKDFEKRLRMAKCPKRATHRKPKKARRKPCER